MEANVKRHYLGPVPHVYVVVAEPRSHGAIANSLQWSPTHMDIMAGTPPLVVNYYLNTVLLKYESTVTSRLGSLVVKAPF